MDICQGNSKHICSECGIEYNCYACPDPKNPEYTSTMCTLCLDFWLDSVFKQPYPENTK